MPTEAARQQSEQEDFEEMVSDIGQALVAGQSQQSIIDALVGEDGDSESREAITELVFQVANSIAERSSQMAEEENPAASWMIWIGLIVFVNILSAAFDWPFWVY